MIRQFLTTLYARNTPLTVLGGVSLFATGVLFLAMPFWQTEVLGINALIKPSKFFLSTVFFTWTMAWFAAYIPDRRKMRVYAWVVVVVMSFENIYILYQAMLGELSHFNTSTLFNDVMFALMGLAIGVMTFWTLYIGVLFWRAALPDLPPAYRWGIRLGILYFVVFAFSGYLMAGNGAHTVGSPDGGPGLPYVNWSTGFGDIRIAHFLGMHALQILPLTAWYWLQKTSSFLWFAVVYFLLVAGMLYLALQGIPMVAVQ